MPQATILVIQLPNLGLNRRWACFKEVLVRYEAGRLCHLGFRAKEIGQSRFDGENGSREESDEYVDKIVEDVNQRIYGIDWNIDRNVWGMKFATGRLVMPGVGRVLFNLIASEPKRAKNGFYLGTELQFDIHAIDIAGNGDWLW